jgi:uncharacterized membrane protein
LSKAKPTPKQLNLNKLSDAGELKFCGCPTPAEPILESRAVQAPGVVDMAKKFMDKMKEGVSVQEMEDFARRYTIEVFSVLAIIIGAVSSMYDFFTGPKMTIVFAAVGFILAIFSPVPVERALKQFYSFTYKQEKMTQLILGCVKIVIGLFIPFVLFGIVGLLAGTSYHYYTRQAQVVSENKHHHHHHSSGEEHD